MLQLDAVVGDVMGNAKRIVAAAIEACTRGAHVAATAELAIPGYPPRDLLLVSSFAEACGRALELVVREAPAELPLVVGTIAPAPSGSGVQNVAVLVHRGRVVAAFPKTLLPTYDVFDERRYFEPGVAPERAVFDVEIDGVATPIGVVVCEDGWSDEIFWGDRRRYTVDPVAEVARAGARLVINLSASPFAVGVRATRRRLVTHAAKRHGVSFVYVNTVGGNDGLVFDGGSFAVGSDGEGRGEAASFVESVHIVDLAAAPIAWSERDELDDTYDALVLGLRDYVRKVGITRAVIGVSGGIDSALVAALAAEALGSEQVTGIAMPSPYSSDHSLRDARQLAENLGISFYVSPIDEMFSAYRHALAPLMDAMPAPLGWNDLTEENLQSRIRGATLMAISNRTGAVVLTTGNKSECAVGYCTLYGDTCGGLAVIGDLFKRDVYALSRRINERALARGKRPPIPLSTLEKPPSAELRPGQLDQDDLPPYEVLDRILEALIERELGVVDAAKATGEPLELVRAIAKRLRGSEYKRQQLPPTLRVTERAWVGRAYPIAQRFED